MVRLYLKIILFLAEYSLFLGSFGCPKCLNPGISVKTYNGSKKLVYVHSEYDNDLKSESWYTKAYREIALLKASGATSVFYGVSASVISKCILQLI